MTFQIDLDVLTSHDRYKLLTAVVIPRPLAWITTLSVSGTVNAAPYSFFNIFGQDPAVVIVGFEHRADGSAKDTETNIDATGEFVVNIATPESVKALVATAATYAPDESEPKALSLNLAASAKVAPPRFADVPVAIECVRMFALSLSQERSILVGRAVGMAARDGLVDPDTLRVDWGKQFPLARLYADRYARLDEIKECAIPGPHHKAGNQKD